MTDNETLIALARQIGEVMMPGIDDSPDGLVIDWMPIALWVAERDGERLQTIERLSDALSLSHPISDVQARPGALSFLAEELIAERDHLRAIFVREHGGAPAAEGPKGEQWHLHWQFSSDVWSENEPSHKLQARVVAANKLAAAAFVPELYQWIAFIDESVHGTDLAVRWQYVDPSTREQFALQWDERDDSDALFHAFENHELEQIGTSGSDGLCIWDEYKNFSVPWAVIEQAHRRQCRRRPR